jgi:hypothetical protein
MAARKRLDIRKAIKRPGAFRKKAQQRGLSTREFMNRVLANPRAYDKLTVMQARFAKTLDRLRPRRKRR